MQTAIQPRRYPNPTPDQGAISHVLRTVAKISGFRVVDFLGKTVAQKTIAQARTAAIHAVEQITPPLSIDQIGEIFHRHYTSIQYTLLRHAMLLATDSDYQALHARCQQALNPGAILAARHDCGSGLDYGICPACKRGHGYPMAIAATPTPLP